MNFLTNQAEIREWVAEHIGDYTASILTFRADGLVDVACDVNLQSCNLTQLPFRFGNVNGLFDCSKNKLTSLEGSPRQVSSKFACSQNQLKTLQGCPDLVGGNFLCGSNWLTSLDYLPKMINSNLFCSDNPLTGGMLSVFMVDNLSKIYARTSLGDAMNIINKHLATDTTDNERDIFACQQELIEAGFERFAQI